MHYTILSTAEPKRTGQIVNVINAHNAGTEDSNRIFIQDRVITFTNEFKPRDHTIGIKIEEARKAMIAKEASTFWTWTNPTVQSQAHGKRRAEFTPEKLQRMDDPATLQGESSSSGVAVLAANDEETTRLKAALEEAERVMTTKDAETTRLKAALEEAERVMATKDAAMAETTRLKTTLEEAIVTKDAETTRLTTALEEAITTKNAEIAGLTEQTAQFQVKLAEVESTFETLSLAHAGHVEAKDAVIALRDEDIKSKDTEIAGLRNILAERDNELRTKNTEIADLKEQTAALIVRVNASSEGEAKAARIAELEHKVQGVQAELTKVQAELIKVTQRKNDYMKDMKDQEEYINHEMTKQAREIGVLKNTHRCEMDELREEHKQKIASLPPVITTSRVQGTQEDASFLFKIDTLDEVKDYLSKMFEKTTPPKDKEIIRLKHEVAQVEYYIIRLIAGLENSPKITKIPHWRLIHDKIAADDGSRYHTFALP